jgi:hypothetical protein
VQPPSLHGTYYEAESTIWISSSRHPDGVIQTAFHEAYHLAELRCTGDEIAVLREASTNGPTMPRSDDCNEYWCRGHEVRARAFAAWGYAHWLMGTTPVARIGDPAHIKLWAMIYNGGLGARTRRHIHHSRLPDTLRQHTAEPSVGRKVMSATLSVLATAFDWVIDAFRPGAPPALRGK